MLNIEHEDTLVNSIEGVTRAANTLQQVVLVETPDWQPASIWMKGLPHDQIT